LRAKSSRARRVSSGATTEVNWRPVWSPTSSFAASFIHLTTPARSIT
jgi:hypothetical protein